ncbi:TetR/AcrR family transcriptional regulator [Natroniella sp. ANB-PHB2]|uniref:TetR/AcrR family transcriptional regulator n=1 Tax=Natroniella sp. ANB-PHB2 TaxID=3384444 RepID=UPI0038D4A870
MNKTGSDRKDRVISAAIDLFSKQGFHETTVSEIADLAGVAKGTVYWYFDSKRELFQGILIEKLEQLESEVIEEVEVENSPLKKLREIIYVYLKFYQEGKKVSKMFRECTTALEKEFFNGYIIEFNQRQVEIVAGVINAAKKEELVTSNQDNLDLARLLLGMIRTFNPHLYYKNDLIEKVEVIEDVFLNGISK